MASWQVLYSFQRLDVDDNEGKPGEQKIHLHVVTPAGTPFRCQSLSRRCLADSGCPAKRLKLGGLGRCAPPKETAGTNPAPSRNVRSRHPPDIGHVGTIWIVIFNHPVLVDQ